MMSLAKRLISVTGSASARSLSIKGMDMVHDGLSPREKGFFKVAVVGSGPAGFYLAQHLLRHGPDQLSVDIYERLPVPFGLVRYGVAPDHPDVKNVDSTFSKVAKHSRARFVGNVAVGQDVRLEELRHAYNSLVLAYGAAKDRELGVPGENLGNVLAARKFVSYYNGLPEASNLKIRLDAHNTAVVVGVGNVALDVARILLTPIDVLMKTDMTDEALDLLKGSRITRVHIVGRRGPLQVAFTIKELREMVNLQGCVPRFHRGDFEPISGMVDKLERPRKRLTDLMVKTALNKPTEKQLATWSQGSEKKEWFLDLLRSPVAFLPSDSDVDTVGGIKLVKNEMRGDPLKDQTVLATGQHEIIECGLVLKSIGYKSVQVEPGIPYDEGRGIIPNVGGRVEGWPGLYCAGWLATGPRGVIVDTMTESFHVSQNIINDIADLEQIQDGPKPGFEFVKELLEKRQIRSVSFRDWERIDDKEKATGKMHGKPRQKLTDVGQMVSLLQNNTKSSKSDL